MTTASAANSRRIRRLLADPRVVYGGLTISVLGMIALLAPWIALHSPSEQNLMRAMLPAAWQPGGSREFLLGTDALGRDLLSRLVFGTRVTALVAISAPVCAALIGTTLAVLAGCLGGRAERLVLQAVDVWMSFPAIVMGLVLMLALGPSVKNLILSIVLVDWTRFCRVLRAEVALVRRKDYIAAAQIAGASWAQIVCRDVLPAIAAPLVILLTTEMAVAVVAESVLSFVGVSVPADTATWGGMISEGLANVFSAPLALVAPVICMTATVSGITFFGDGLRRAIDPRLYERREVNA